MIDSLVTRVSVRALSLALLNITMRLEGGSNHQLTLRPAVPTTDRKFLLKLLQIELAAHPPQAAIVALTIAAETGQAGFDIRHARIARYLDLCMRMRDLPRHLGQHSGGMVICARMLNRVLPIERASMPGRCVVQWDKEDCADMGIIKVDLLGLGMMAVLKDSIELITRHHRGHVDLAALPRDATVYETLCKADTVGMLQVESRAQMASLPHNAPTQFYDLVVQVAIIRPGPIVGKIMHPYMRRRQGKEEVTYPHPLLEPVLRRTLGVPLFQEQLLRTRWGLCIC